MIDLQNDYFPGGKFPLRNTDTVLANIEQTIARAKASDVPVIHIQHIAMQGMVIPLSIQLAAQWILELLVERVDYDGERRQVSLTFRPCGIRSLTQEVQEAA